MKMGSHRLVFLHTIDQMLKHRIIALDCSHFNGHIFECLKLVSLILYCFIYTKENMQSINIEK